MDESPPQQPPKPKPPPTANLPPPPSRIKPVPPPNFRPKPRRRRSFCRLCCCTTCIVLLILILALVIAAGIFYLIYEPSLPQFRLASFRVPTLNVTDSAADGPSLNADTASRVEVKNRSGKMTWRFAQTRVAISAENGDVNLGSTTVAGFSVRERGVSELKAETKVRNQAVNEKQKRRLKGAVDGKALAPSLEVRTKTGVGLSGWKSPYLAVTVVCGGVTMRQLERGDSPRCTITLLKWIKIR